MSPAPRLWYHIAFRVFPLAYLKKKLCSCDIFQRLKWVEGLWGPHLLGWRPIFHSISYGGGNSLTHSFFLHTSPLAPFHQLIQFGLVLRGLNQRPQLPFALNFFSIVPFPIPNSQEVVSHPIMAWRKRICCQTKDPNSVFTCLTFQILHFEFFFGSGMKQISLWFNFV